MLTVINSYLDQACIACLMVRTHSSNMTHSRFAVTSLLHNPVRSASLSQPTAPPRGEDAVMSEEQGWAAGLQEQRLRS